MRPRILLTITLLFLASLITAWAQICPRGYWAAEVQSASTQKAINQYSSDRKYALPYGPIGNTPICRFCPKISCFIMRQVYDKKDSGADSRKPRKPRNSTKSLTTTPKPDPAELFTQSAYSTSTSSPDTNKEMNITMSCALYSDLPFPEQIVTYLDCVQIGQRDLYYLFIYTPVNKEKEVMPVDCIDPNFLKWIPSHERLKGIELGFPMRRLPPFFFRYYRDIMAVSRNLWL